MARTGRPLGRPRIHGGDRLLRVTFHTTVHARTALEAWAVLYTKPEDRLRTGKNMSKSEAFRQICLLAQKKIERDCARDTE